MASVAVAHGTKTITIEPYNRKSPFNSIRLTPVPAHNSQTDGREVTEKDLVADASSLRAKYFPNQDIADVEKRFNIRKFQEAAPSAHNDVPVIELDSIDFSKYIEGPEGLECRKQLAAKLEKSISTYGFFNITNWGFDPKKLEYLRAISQSVLEIPEEDKFNYLAGARQTDLEDRTKSLGGERGLGFKPRGYWAMQHGVRDSIEHYNLRDMNQDDYFFDPNRKYPDVVRAFLPELSEYYKFLHFQVLRRLCNLCDIILEKPEGFLWENYFKVYKNDLKNSGTGFGRLMHYLGMTEDEEKLTNKTWLRGHSDGTAFTFITSQPILSLQIRDYYTGQWRYVGHKPNALIVNIGDAMEFITGSYFKSSIHRVISPPEDQKKFERLVLIYFQTPKLTSVIDPDSLNSPKLQRLGYNTPEEWEKCTFADWDEEKGRLFGRKDVNDVQGDEPLLVKIFGRYHERWWQAVKEN
ncbi:hypothetical protein DASC09_053190 [Saccharomycopsis crataegensis]|uniref:Fe2OG dioxygenase domain-containing protein n=1 Tax=Saccharomycopsis crataegensis TaxID=43959 RepID=A0AAV5QU15_9ASCO|nr:hypothetical protein DASC09_053190 [Saccharomycopsis crataegensis]